MRARARRATRCASSPGRCPSLSTVCRAARPSTSACRAGTFRVPAARQAGVEGRTAGVAVAWSSAPNVAAVSRRLRPRRARGRRMHPSTSSPTRPSRLVVHMEVDAGAVPSSTRGVAAVATIEHDVVSWVAGSTHERRARARRAGVVPARPRRCRLAAGVGDPDDGQRAGRHELAATDGAAVLHAGGHDACASMKASTSARWNRRWPPGVRNERSFPSSAQRRTDSAEQPNSTATWPAVSGR